MSNKCFECKKAYGGCSWTECDPITHAIRFEYPAGCTFNTNHDITYCPLFEQDIRENKSAKGLSFFEWVASTGLHRRITYQDYVRAGGKEKKPRRSVKIRNLTDGNVFLSMISACRYYDIPEKTMQHQVHNARSNGRLFFNCHEMQWEILEGEEA